MNLFKTERPSRDKENAIRSMQKIEEPMVRIGFNISYKLKTKLKINAAKNNISYTDIIISLIEKYLEAEGEEGR